MIHRLSKNSSPDTSVPDPRTVSAISPSDHDASTELSKLPIATIFAIPKPFVGSADRIQKNALRSWMRLQPYVEVLLIGDEPGIPEAAAELGVRHFNGLQFNEHGTPLVSSAFEIAHRETISPLLVYCNCDVILLRDFSQTMQRLLEAHLDRFVAFGRRIDLAVEKELRLEDRIELESLLTNCKKLGQPSSIVCKEYFAFTRELYGSMPDFAVGRGNWDNWMIHSAKQRNVPVIDISSGVTAIHQSHDYSHTGKSRWKCYVGGAEAKENERLAGGRHWVGGSTATWKMDDRGVRKIRLNRLNLKFWLDGWRFLKLTLNLLLGRQD